MNKISIIIPAYNEAESLPILLADIQDALKTQEYSAEVIVINDGSTDATTNVLNTLTIQLSLTIHVIHFTHNRGKAEALTAGFQKASGDVIITMDADGQDDPYEISKLIAVLEQKNVDLVSGWKYPRKDPIEKRMFSFVFNRVTSVLTGVKLHDMNCGFKAYRSEVIKELKLYGELHRYIPVFAHATGFSVREVKVKHHPRQFGVSKYGFKRIPKGFFDLLTVLFLTRYKKRPMHFFAGIGSLFGLCGIGVFVALSIGHFFTDIEYSLIPFWLSGVLCILTSFMLFSVGLLGELIVALFLTDNQRDKS